MKNKVEEQEAKDMEKEGVEQIKQPIEEGKEPGSPTKGAQSPSYSEMDDVIEEITKIVLTNDEIDPEDVEEKDPRKMLSKQQRNY